MSMAEAVFFVPTTLPTRKLFNNGGRKPKFFVQSPKGQFLSFSWVSSNSSSFNVISILPTSNRTTSLSCSASKTFTKKTQMFSEGRDEDESRLICPGCGVFMQDADPNLPGFFKKRIVPEKNVDDSVDFFSESDEFLEEDEELRDGSISKSNLDEEIEGFPDEISVEESDSESDWEVVKDKERGMKKKKVEEEGRGGLVSKFNQDEEIEGFSDGISMEGIGGGKEEEYGGIDWDSDWEMDEDEETRRKEELDGFAPPGVGYGNITEETLKKLKKEKVSKSEKKQKAREAQRIAGEDSVTVCARCHSLRNYGQVKNQKAENLIPDFDFDRFISTRLMKLGTSAPVVVMVVDCVDFDGSFPKRASKSLFKALERNKIDMKLKKLPKLVLVATKVDLLPSQISPTRLDRWVRNRAKSAGAPKLSGVYLVSAHKDLGVRNLLAFIKELAGPRGNVWVIGAQNAGKSTLINAFAKREGVKITRLTEAAVPGTTLGILRIAGILPAKAKMYDTPGLLHPYLMTMRLNREEQKMVEIRKELQPRTYRIKAGQTVHVGGLMRLDVTQASVQTIYCTICASPNVSLHLGKTENADEIWQKHAGIRLQPPIGQDRIPELGEWKQREIKVSGISWEVNSIEIAAAGLGWFSLGLKGEATVTLWTYDGVDVTQREPLVLDRAPFLERPGFLLPKAISDAIANQSKLNEETKKLKEDRFDSLFNASI